MSEHVVPGRPGRWLAADQDYTALPEPVRQEDTVILQPIGSEHDNIQAGDSLGDGDGD
jgi:hypothetical protein